MTIIVVRTAELMHSNPASDLGFLSFLLIIATHDLCMLHGGTDLLATVVVEHYQTPMLDMHRTGQSEVEVA